MFLTNSSTCLCIYYIVVTYVVGRICAGLGSSWRNASFRRIIAVHRADGFSMRKCCTQKNLPRHTPELSYAYEPIRRLSSQYSQRRHELEEHGGRERGRESGRSDWQMSWDDVENRAKSRVGWWIANGRCDPVEWKHSWVPATRPGPKIGEQVKDGHQG